MDIYVSFLKREKHNITVVCARLGLIVVLVRGGLEIVNVVRELVKNYFPLRERGTPNSNKEKMEKFR